MVKKDALQVYLQGRLFCYFIGRQPDSEGIYFREFLIFTVPENDMPLLKLRQEYNKPAI
jgi:hypothetical protein